MKPSTRNDGNDGLDQDGYRRNVGIVVCNRHHQVLWAKRRRGDGWQFPQGGIEPNETARDAVFRELYEEIGLVAADVQLLGHTARWLRYEVPNVYRMQYGQPQTNIFRGQKQHWYLFYLTAGDARVRLDASNMPEFEAWQWVDYWLPVDRIIAFKRQVYKKALTELEPLLQILPPLG